MKHLHTHIMAALVAMAGLNACENDDQYTLDDIKAMVPDTISICWNGNSVAVEGDVAGYVTCNNAYVTVNSTSQRKLTYLLSGNTSEGQLLIYGQKKLELVLNNVNITNPTGPAINNQCGKSLFITCPAGTTNTLTDGADYDTSLTIDQKGALFSEGQIFFRGAGQLSVTGNYKNAIASDDYIVMDSTATCTVKVVSTNGNGVKANDGFFMYGGTMDVSVSADGAKGIKCDDVFTMTGGDLHIATSGNVVMETVDGVADTSSCAAIKVAYVLTMAGGNMTLESSGDGGKGINADQDVVMTGGTLNANCTGEKVEDDEGETVSNPKAVNSDGHIYLSGGSFNAYSANGRATDCAIDDIQSDRYPTIIGTPTTRTLTKKRVVVVF